MSTIWDSSEDKNDVWVEAKVGISMRNTIATLNIGAHDWDIGEVMSRILAVRVVQGAGTLNTASEARTRQFSRPSHSRTTLARAPEAAH